MLSISKKSSRNNRYLALVGAAVVVPLAASSLLYRLCILAIA
jgi:hypothetical protein